MTTVIRQGHVYRRQHLAGLLSETADAYVFIYEPAYVRSEHPAVSLTLAKRSEAYVSRHLFPFFVSLLAEGNLALEQCRRLRIDESDLFGRLLQTAGGDVIGSVTVVKCAPDFNALEAAHAREAVKGLSND